MTKWERLVPILTRGKWNFMHVVDAVLESSLSRAEKITLIAIASHRSNKHPKPSPGLRRLATLTTQRVDTTADAVSGLVRKGLIRVEPGHRRANVYDLSGTMRALLTVSPIGTVTVPKKDTVTVLPIGTDEAKLTDIDCPDRGSRLSRSRNFDCPDPAYPRIPSEGNQEGSQDPVATSATAQLPLIPSTKQAASHKPQATTKTKAEHGAEHQRVTAAYFQGYKAKRGEDPVFDGAEGKAVNRLLAKCKGDADKACRAVAGAFADDWWSQRVTIQDIAKDPAKFLGPSRRSGRREVQGGAADVARIAEKNARLRTIRGGPSLLDDAE